MWLIHIPMSNSAVIAGSLVTGAISPKTQTSAPVYETNEAATEATYKAYGAAEDMGYVAPSGVAYAPMPKYASPRLNS